MAAIANPLVSVRGPRLQALSGGLLASIFRIVALVFRFQESQDFRVFVVPPIFLMDYTVTHWIDCSKYRVPELMIHIF